jgi:cell division protease FtsH
MTPRIPRNTDPNVPRQPNTPSSSRPAGPPPRWRAWILLAGIILTALLLFRPAMSTTAAPTKLSYTEFVQDVTANQVKTASVGTTGAVKGTLSSGATYTTQVPTALQDNTLDSTLLQHHVQITASGPSSGITLGVVIIDLLPLILLVGVFMFVGRRAQKASGGLGGLMGIARSKAKVYNEDRPTTRFADVAGYEGAKAEVSEVVEFLRNPHRFEQAGAVGPKGVVMVGPPGTGKTLMARAVAGEAGVPFLALTGSSFVELFVGVGASRVRDLFADARKLAPAIIFIDEIDAIGGRRGNGHFGGNDEREQTLNQLLAEMDGFDPATGVVVIAATNRPETLDPALLRPGRFDRNVEIGLPNLAERRSILAVHVRGKRLDPDVDLDAIARGTPGFSGADLANLVNEAAIHAVRADRTLLRAKDFDAARDRLLLGRRETTNALLPDERHSVAVHEAGHALVAALSAHADPVSKVTILPAGRALGVTEQLPEVERHLYSESYLSDSLAVRLGGRAAELLVIGEGSTGAANDLAGATQLATRMVREWGLSDRIGPVGFTPDGPGYLGESGLVARPYAESTQRVIDDEVARLLRKAEQTAIELLRTHRPTLDRVVDLLLEQEVIDGNQLIAAIRETGSEPAARSGAAVAAGSVGSFDTTAA